MLIPRNSLARRITFARFAVQQLAQKRRVMAEIARLEAAPFAFEAPTLTLSASELDWRGTGVIVKTDDRFGVSARGAIWLSRPMSVVMEPKSALWVRIKGSGRIAKIADNDHVFTAWADGEVEVFLKAMSEWASPTGDLISPVRVPTTGEIRVRIGPTVQADTAPRLPNHWQHLWRLGDGTVYMPTAITDEIAIDTHGDVGILQTDIDHVLTPNSRLTWSWRVDALPSRLPEDLTLTHDYLSVAVEFDDGSDLTFMWSAGLSHNHIFTCPLDFWCDRETHWVVRTPKDGLGRWHSEDRALWDDTQNAYGTRPARAVRLWLIANSIFQRNRGLATVRDLRLVEGA